jgi:small-conductance mechanosensitive channel/CRP-like cAMP-binding protein
MHALTSFLDTAWAARSPFLLVAYLLVRYLERAQPESARLSHAGVLLVGHLLSMVVAAGLNAAGYVTELAEIAALGFELLCIVALATKLCFRIVLPRLGIAIPRILADIVTAIAVAVALIVIGKRAGFSVAGLITTSAVLTAVIGFALQDTLGNIMGGLALQLDTSVRVGDWIALGSGQPSGRVTEIRWRYTAIETRAWETIIIPNGVLTKSQVVVSGRRTDQPTRQRREVEFFVDFRTSPTEVIRIVEAAMLGSAISNVAEYPAPHVLFHGVRDSVGLYVVRYWLRDIAIDDPTDSDVRVRVWFATRRANIPLAIPASAVFLTTESHERSNRKSQHELNQRLTALHTVDLFRALPEATARSLANEMNAMPFGAGEVITQEGAHEDDLYILVSGTAVVRIGQDVAAREVARLHAGDFFGEMSLMTGETRTATVIAAQDLECYRISKRTFERVLRESPEIADQIAGILAARREALSAAKGDHDDEGSGRLETAKRDLLGRIRGFFGLVPELSSDRDDRHDDESR